MSPRTSLEEECTSGEYIFLFCICEKNYIYNYYKKSAEIYMICQIICIRICNAWEISQPARKAKLKLKELDNCQVGDRWPVKSPLDDQLWTQSLRDVTHVGAWRNDIFNKFRVHAHEPKRMSMFINCCTSDIHPSVCGCLWRSEDSCCQRSWDGRWMHSL